MESERNIQNTPGGKQSTGTLVAATGSSDSGGSRRPLEQRISEASGRFPINKKTFIGTLNINTLLRAGKLHELGQELDKQKILILALQETRMTEENTIDFGSYRLFKSKTDKRVCKGTPLLGMAFAVHKKILQSVTEIKAINNRLMTLRLKSANKTYTFINAHAPVNEDNKRNRDDTDKYWDKLEKTMERIPLGDVKILLGDFNAQLGKERVYRKIIGRYPGHRMTNKNGQRLVDLCSQNNMKIMSTHFKKATKKTKTWRSPVKLLGEFQIDHVAISYPNFREIMNVQVRKGANVDSDHYLTRIKVRLIPKRQNKRTTGIPKFDLTKLKTTKIAEEWEKETAKTWEDVKVKIISKAKELIPISKKKKHPWWNETCEKAVEVRKKVYEDWNSDRTEEKLKMFAEARKQATRTIRTVKRQYEGKQLEKIEEDFRNHNMRDFYRTFRNNIIGYQPQNLCFRKENGQLALSNKENCEELAKYFETLLNCPEPTERFARVQGVERNEDSKAPEEEEIRRQIKKLKNGKAAGEDGIVAEFLKVAGPKTIQEITRILQNIWETEKIPEDWKSAVIHPLYKKGERTDVNNYRGISLLPVAYKILSQCLLDRTQAQLEHTIGEYQAGFRPGRSCMEQILNLKTILRYQKLRGRETVCTFVDFKKAYDSVDRQALFQELEELGLDRKTTEIIKQTLTNTKSKVKFMGELSSEFEIKTGVRQGDGLSPLLFNLILNKVIKEWIKELKEKEIFDPIRLGSKNLGVEVICLAFADDLAILAKNVETAQQQVEILKESAAKVGLQISFDKTQYISNQKIAPKSIVTKYGKINRVHKFKYLGEIILANGLEREANEWRNHKLKRAFWMTGNVYNKKCISRNTKIRHYNTVVKPEGLYAAETLTMNRKGEMEEIKKTERKIIRKILGPNKTEEGYRLRSRQETERMSNIFHDMKKRRLRFFGHIKRMDNSRLTKQIIEYTEKIKNLGWITEVKKDLKEARITERDITNRTQFRYKVDKWEVCQENKKMKTGTKWSEDRKKAHSEKMKEIWKKKKAHKK